MSNSEFVSETLEQLLVSLADSLKDAQEILNDSSGVDRFGRPVPRYQLPYLDFDLKVDLETSQDTDGNPFLRLRPLGLTKNESTVSEISSSISGRFVAIPPGEGLPIPLIELKSRRKGNSRTHILEVNVMNTAGEVIPGVAVELNFDVPASQALSAAGRAQPPSLHSAKLADAILITDEQGYASTELTISKDDSPKASFVICAEYGRQKAHITVSAGKA